MTKVSQESFVPFNSADHGAKLSIEASALVRLDAVQQESLLGSIPFAVRIHAINPEFLTMVAYRSVSTALCLPVPARFAGVANAVFVPENRGASSRGPFTPTAQSRYGHLCCTMLRGSRMRGICWDLE